MEKETASRVVIRTSYHEHEGLIPGATSIWKTGKAVRTEYHQVLRVAVTDFENNWSFSMWFHHVWPIGKPPRTLKVGDYTFLYAASKQHAVVQVKALLGDALGEVCDLIPTLTR